MRSLERVQPGGKDFPGEFPCPARHTHATRWQCKVHRSPSSRIGSAMPTHAYPKLCAELRRGDERDAGSEAQKIAKIRVLACYSVQRLQDHTVHISSVAPINRGRCGTASERNQLGLHRRRLGTD
jgi:hypothetical protein